jgi:hypothetical protein
MRDQPEVRRDEAAMRATRNAELHAREKVPLVMRARFEKTFLGLGAFAGLALLLGGTYLMAEAWANPLKASDVGVLVAGFSLALASFVLVYFVLPQRRTALAKRERSTRHEARRKGAALTPYGEVMQSRVAVKQEMSAGKNLPGPM